MVLQTAITEVVQEGEKSVRVRTVGFELYFGRYGGVNEEELDRGGRSSGQETAWVWALCVLGYHRDLSIGTE